MLFYVAHPLGTGSDRIANISRAKRWLQYLLKEYPDEVFLMPWIPYAEVLEDKVENHRRGLRDDLAILARCDGIVLVGGRVSPGMEQELAKAVELGKQVRNYTHLGEEPPSSGR